jgi:tripartite-type tricarboxylate transporter receptor subunit TctC
MELTPVARLAEDTFVLWVSSETSIKSVDDYVAAVNKAGMDNWKMGGTGTGQEDSLVTAMLEKAYGVRHTYVPFKGGGTVAKNLIGNHVESTVNNPSEQLGFYEAGKSRPLIPADAQAFYVDVFNKVNESAEWKEYTAKKALNRAFLTGDALMTYFEAEREKHRGLLMATGEIK